MSSFDPNKLDIDFDKLDAPSSSDKQDAKKEASLQENKPKKTSSATGTETEKKSVSKADTHKPVSKQEVEHSPHTPVYDINIKTLQDIVASLLEDQYDFVTLEPDVDFVRVIFRKDNAIVASKKIHHATYTQLTLKIKTLSHMNLEDTTSSQTGTGELKYKNTWYSIASKTAPDEFGEKVFFKITPVSKKVSAQKNQQASLKNMLKFIGVVALLFCILGGAFLTFVVLNAKTVQDVNFFLSLGINPNDINVFIQQIVTFIFLILVFLETVFTCIYGFKFALTKKIEKRKKVATGILASVFLIITFVTATLWLFVDKQIKGLPNWGDVARGDVQIYDTALLSSQQFSVDQALLGPAQLTGLIGPIDIRFDVQVLSDNEARKGFTIEKYIWDFGEKNGSDTGLLETSQPVIFYSFDEKKRYDVSLTLEGVDALGKPLTKTQNIPQIEVTDLIEIREQNLDSGGKMLRFNAESLRQRGTLEWYYGGDFETPVSKGYIFQPGKPIFEETIIALAIRNSLEQTISHFDRVFLIQPDQDEAISGNIIATADEDNELLYHFEIQDISNDFGDGIIENFQWNIDNKEFSLPGSITDPGKASRVSYEFENFGEHEIEVVLTDSLGKTTPLRSTLTIDKQLLLKTPLEIYEGESLLDSVEYNSKNQEYIIDAFGVPSQLQFSARGVKTDDPLYSLDSVTWDFNSDGDIDETGMYVSYDVPTEGNYELTLHYNFIHRKKKTSVKLSEKIYIQAIKKQVNLKLDIEKQSQYVPVTVRFDASQSQVLGQNIVSFEYDYGNGIIEKRDAINQGHIYRQPGEYDVVLTVTTDTGEKHSLTKKLVLTTRPDIVQITPSLYDAPVGQEIDFSSAQSSGQIVSYYWKFGDGNTSAEANPSHSYDAAGDYQVELMIEFANNNVKTDTIDITIVP